MMLRLIVYLSKIFLARWSVTAFGMVVLVGLLDSLANASDISASGVEGGALRYMSLRAPVIFDQIFLFSLMLALLLTFVSLIRRNELVALQGIGLSVFAQVRALAPVVVGAAIASGIFIDRMLPPSVQALNDLGIGEYQGGNVTEDEPLWVNDNQVFVRMQGRDGLNTLTKLTFFLRDERGHVEGVTWADRAEYTGNAWLLSGTSTLNIDGSNTQAEALAMWNTSQTPLLIDKLAAEPRNLSVTDLAAFASFRGSGSRPSAAYKVWHLKRLFLPLSAFAMLVLAAPVMQRLGRRDSGTGALIIGVGISFLFMIVDGITATMGANGALLPSVAALGPTIVLTGIGLHLWLRQEILG